MQVKIDLQVKNPRPHLQEISQSEWDAITLSSWFDSDDLSKPTPGAIQLSESTRELLQTCSDALRAGGFFFVYGAPHRLPYYAAILEELGGDDWRLEFKYWIGIALNEQERVKSLYPAHVGLLLFHKVSIKGHTSFDLDKSVRVPYCHCPACGMNVRDWGGKKHLLNPSGAALSDVWTDLPVRHICGNRIPGDVFQRVYALAGGAKTRMLHVIEGEPETEHRRGVEAKPISRDIAEPAPLVVDRIETADCIAFMESLLPEYENRAFDLVFADPPYNLDKMYENYKDAHAEANYLAWTDRWLELCVRLLKPGGSLYVVNLPKWGLHHARTLDRLLDFRHWVVWQALAEPRGKLLPAHYALLYYTKPGGAPVFNYRRDGRANSVGPLDSPEYCLRASCIKKRKGSGDDRKVPLTDIWTDIYRIRHKRDRDFHPCQLPEKLMERVIMLSSKPGQLVYDPLCGVGTTAIAARRLGRHFISTDVDPSYVEITKDKLSRMDFNLQETGEHVVPRKSTRRAPRVVTKKDVESVVQQLALELGRIPEMEDIRSANPKVYDEIGKLYPNPRKVLGAARVALDKAK
jgi:site-specific DNA-methyltransferase (adenine-specific)